MAKHRDEAARDLHAWQTSARASSCININPNLSTPGNTVLYSVYSGGVSFMLDHTSVFVPLRVLTSFSDRGCLRLTSVLRETREGRGGERRWSGRRGRRSKGAGIVLPDLAQDRPPDVRPCTNAKSSSPLRPRSVTHPLSGRQPLSDPPLRRRRRRRCFMNSHRSRGLEKSAGHT